MDFLSSEMSSEKALSAYEDYNPQMSKLEIQFRAKRLTSDETIKKLIKMLETQLQRIDISVRLDINSGDPMLRVVEAVKCCIDEIMEVKERLKMNSFVSNYGDLDRSQYQDEVNNRAAAEKLSVANKQLIHFERLLNKKEKSILEKEKKILEQQQEMDREREQIEVTKERMRKIQELGTHVNFSFKDDPENLRSLATRLAAEKQAIELKKNEISEQVKILETGIEHLEREKLSNNDLLEENKKMLETVNKEKFEVNETKKIIEEQKKEMIEIKTTNDKLLEMVKKERSNIKVEEEKLLRQKFDLDAKIVYFNREKNDFAKNSAELESEKNKLFLEKESLQKIKQQLQEEKDLLKQEYQSLEEIKQQLITQNQLDFEAKSRTLLQREEEIENSIIDLKLQVDSYNAQIDEREYLLRDREEKIAENEKQIKVNNANIRLAEMSLTECKNQCEELMGILLPKIEQCYGDLTGILKGALDSKARLESLINIQPGKFICIRCNNSAKIPTKGLEEQYNEIRAKVLVLNAKEEEVRLQELKNLALADQLRAALTDFEEKKKMYEKEIVAEKEKLRRNFIQLENSLKMIREKEIELNMMRTELSEREKILRSWEASTS